MKIVRYHHNKPDTNGRIESATNGLVRAFYRLLTKISLCTIYLFDDAYVVLSKEFCGSFSRFTGIRSASKLVAINNPQTLTPTEGEKENVILYCGRLDEHQKRVTRVFEIWRMVCGRLPDWRLEIVGDGPDRAQYEKLAAELPRTEFTGVKDPAENYAHSKVLLMTSDYEGWPRVLVEAMSSRCVPVVLGSFESVSEIVTDGQDGYVLPIPYNPSSFADRLEALAKDAGRLEAMASAAEMSSRRFSVKATADRWEELFERLVAK